MFLQELREKIVEINNIKIKFRYPTIGDEIQIESKKNILTRGQYPSLALSVMANQQAILDITDAISVLSICANFVDNKENRFWEGMIDEDGKEFVLEVYKQFEEWRLSFRRKNKKHVGKKSSDDSGE